MTCLLLARKAVLLLLYLLCYCFTYLLAALLAATCLVRERARKATEVRSQLRHADFQRAQVRVVLLRYA